jgi:MFS family permease
MTSRQRQGWMIIAGIALTNFVVMGPSIGTIGIFFTPLIKQFGWSRAEVSRTATAFLIAMGLINPLVGWLMDRVPARIPMSIGVILAGASFLVASRVNTLSGLVLSYALIGVGVGASTILPGMIVAANWFSDRRGVAIGLTIAGAGLGGCVLPPLVEHLILSYGWRTTMVLIGIPMFVIALPIITLVIRTRPAGETAEEKAQALPGLELGPALRSAAFWLLAAIHLVFTVAFAGSYFHMVPFLIGAGYSPQTAAFIFGAQAAISLPGYVVLGTLADRFGAKVVLGTGLTMQAISMMLLLGLGNHHFATGLLPVFIVCYGLTVGVGTAIGAVLIAEALGLRSYGSLTGIIGLIATVGSGIGPIVAGRIYDLTASYTRSYELCAVLMLTGAILTSLVYPAEGREQIAAVATAAPQQGFD